MRRLAVLLSAILLSWATEIRADEDIFAPPPPVQLTAFPDAEHAVTKDISAAAGGEIVATAKDGTRFRVVFPKNSLLVDTKITVAPWAFADGFDGAPTIGFDVQPSGTILFNPAVVYIEPGDNAVKQAARGDVLFFETQGEYQSEARIALTPKDGFGLYLFHFSGGGVFADGDQVTRFFLPPKGWSDFSDLAQRERESGLTYEQVMDRIKGWQRRVDQDRQAGRLSDFKADEELEIMKHMLAQAWEAGAERRAALVAQAMQQGAQRQALALENAAAIAQSGNWMDRQLLLQTIGEWLSFQRQQELMGQPENAEAIADLQEFLLTFMENVAERCDAEVMAQREILGIARMGVLMGGDEDHWSNLTKRLSACKPKVSLDQAIQRCFEIGDYHLLVDLYGWLMSSDGAESLEMSDLPGPDKAAALKSKAIDALKHCAVYEVTLRVDSEVRERVSYALNTQPRQPSDEVSYVWRWNDTTVAGFSPGTAGAIDEVLGGEISGPEHGTLSGCGCSIVDAGWLESCTIRVCERHLITDAPPPPILLTDLTFDGRVLEHATFQIAPAHNILRYTCYSQFGEQHCSDEGGTEMTMTGCLGQEKIPGGLTIPMTAMAGSGAWRGEIACDQYIARADRPPDDGYTKQSEKGEIRIRHIGMR